MMNDIEYTKMNDVEMQHFWYKTIHNLILQNTKQGINLLDLGCGTGGVVNKVKHQFQTVVGMDISELSLSFAKVKNPEVEFIQSDLNDLKLDHQYSQITCIDVLEYIEDDNSFIQKIHDALAENGTFILNVPAYKWLLSYHDEKVGQQKRYEKKEIVELLERNGLKIKFITFWNTLLFPILLIKRKFLKSESSDVENIHPVVNKILFNVMRIELFILRFKIRLPFGSSIFVVVTK
jgi:2-polyprenyl-3-methyl-5-hydroxy-6-metoxy-1,4-benzoquinol methylase